METGGGTDLKIWVEGVTPSKSQSGSGVYAALILRRCRLQKIGMRGSPFENLITFDPFCNQHYGNVGQFFLDFVNFFLLDFVNFFLLLQCVIDLIH